MDGVSDKKCNKNICLLHIHHVVLYVFGQVVPISSRLCREPMQAMSQRLLEELFGSALWYRLAKP